MKKAVILVAQENFREDELDAVRKILESRKIDTQIAAKTRFKAKGKSGMEIKPDLAVAEIEADDFDALVLIGGPGCQQYLADEVALKVINSFKKPSKVLAASCLAPSVLASAGALMGKKATAFPTEEDNLKNKGAEYTGMPVQVDGNVVTCKDPMDAGKLGDQVAYLLEGL